MNIPCSVSAVPREVIFVVADGSGGQSEPAMVVINFNSVDNPPVLDLNGPREPQRNYSTTFRENSAPVSVSKIITCTS